MRLFGVFEAFRRTVGGIEFVCNDGDIFEEEDLKWVCDNNVANCIDFVSLVSDMIFRGALLLWGEEDLDMTSQGRY